MKGKTGGGRRFMKKTATETVSKVRERKTEQEAEGVVLKVTE